MNPMNGWISFPMIESLNHRDFAIRKFCPARLVEQEQGGGGGDSKLWEEEEALFNYEIELWSSPSDHDHTTTTTTPHLASFEEEEFVESFFNMDSYENDDKFSILPQDHQKLPFDCFQDDDNDEKFSIIDNVFEEVPLMIDEEMEEIICDDHDQVLEGGVSLEMVTQEEVTVSHGVDQGLHLVHLLLACAEAVGCRDTQLANSMLNQVWESASPWGDSLQRVSYCFAIGLKSRLSHLLHNVNANGTLFINNNGANMDRFSSLINKEEKLEAFQLLYQTTPYIAFGFMAANEAICEAAQGKESLHIINLGMEHALQWPSLIRTLASRPEGSPKLIRITGLIKSTDDHHLNLSSELEANMKGVIEDAKALGIPLEFNMVSESVFTPELLTTETLNLREGEALFVNSIMRLHKYVKESRGSLKAVLQAIKKLSPTLLTVVEQDSNHNGPFFLGRFLESLHYYSAIFDSLEASLSRSSPQRMKIERVHFAEEICNIVAYEGTDRIERHERADQWRRQLGRAGFQVVGLKCMSQARMMLSVYGCDGYTLASEKGCLLLGWKGRPIMLASAWQLHH